MICDNRTDPSSARIRTIKVSSIEVVRSRSAQLLPVFFPMNILQMSFDSLDDPL
jgi:hypothetical protein